jgi:hypothetical protein
MDCGEHLIRKQTEAKQKQKKAKKSYAIICYSIFPDAKVRKGQTTPMKVRESQKMMRFIICKSA